MAITATDVKLYESERLTDTDDGGGRATGNVITDGDVNNLFPDISRLDRTIGDVALRKAFVGINTANADTYLGAHAVLTARPADPNVGTVLFHAAAEDEERAAAANRIESYVVRGAVTGWYLLGTQYPGQRLIIGFQEDIQEMPEPGQVFELVNTSAQSQFVRITEVEAVMETFVYVGSKTEYLPRRKLTLGISAPLETTFQGGSPTPGGTSTPASTIHRTEVADAARYYGLMTLAEAADQGDLALKVASIFAPLVPSAQRESVWADQPGGYSRALLLPIEAGTRSESASITYAGTALVFYAKRPIVPGSMTVTIGGSSVYSDDGLGGFVHESGADVYTGTIDYRSGVVTANRPGYGGPVAMTIDYQAGAPLTGKAESGGIAVTVQNPGFSWTLNMAAAKPRPGTLLISYRAQGKWQSAWDNGAGAITGMASGTLNYATGTAVLTLPAYPDAGSYIVYAWIADVADEFTVHSGSTNLNPEYTIQAAANLQPGSVTVSWTQGSAKTATDNGHGQLSGDATGTVNYGSGQVVLRPATLIDSGTSITVDHDGATAGTGLEAVSLSPDVNGAASGSIAGAPLLAGSVSFTFNVLRRKTHARDDIDNSDTWELDYLYQKVIIDNGAGGFSDRDGNVVNGSIDYTTGAWTLTIEDQYQYEAVTSTRTGSWGWGVWNQTDWITLQEQYTGVCNIRYQAAGATHATTQTVLDVAELAIPLVAGGGPILPRSVLFTFGGASFVDQDGILYQNPSNVTGLGTAVGSIDYAAHTATLTSWPDGAGSTVTINTMATARRALASSVMLFRTPASPLRPGSLQLTAVRADTGTLITASADQDGTITSPGELAGYVNTETGLVELWFTSNDQDDTGASDIPIFPASVRYNAVSYTYLPLDAALIGIDPVRLPADGRVPICRDGDVIVLAHTASTDAGTPSAGQVVNLARDHQAGITVVDANGVALAAAQYSVDLALGRVTFANPLTLEDEQANALTTPLAIEDRIEHMTVVADTQVSGDLAMIAPLAHAYPAGSRVSSALLWGDIAARVLNEFTQKTWNSSTPNWTASRSGDDTTASYNLIDYPVQVNNNGAITEKWALVFTTTNAFQIVGEQVGIIGTGLTSADCAPVNPNTGNPYFLVPLDGWGSGWVAGNVLRFDTAGCLAPLWLARTVLSGQGTVDDDSVTVQIRGDAD